MQLDAGKEGVNAGGSEQATTTSKNLTKMLPKILVPIASQELREMMEDVVNKKIPEVILSAVTQVMQPIMEDLVKTKIPEVIQSAVPQVMKPIVEDLLKTKFQEIDNLVPQMLPTMEDSIHKVVNEEIQSAKEGSLAGDNWFSTNVVAVSNERNLRLKFSEAPDNVLTGKEIKSIGGTPIIVAVVDETGQVIESGPESCAKVEILFLEASENDKENNWSHEDFCNRIIKESDKKRPHFAKKYYVHLEKGMGALSNAKLASSSEWTNSCKCRLGALVAENLNGTKVQEAWTEPFLVSDSRGQLYGKRHPPFLSDDVWRLENIGRDGERCKRLKRNNVSTVEDFLFLHSVNPQKLKDIIRAGENAWKVLENHAQSCIIDDTRIRMYTNSSGHNMSVVFDVVGNLKAVIRDSQYVRNDHLSETEKVHAHELLCSAFEHRDSITLHSDEMALMQQFPCQASNASLNASIQERIPGCNHFDPTEPSTSFPSISPSNQSSGNTNSTLRVQVPFQASFAAAIAHIQESSTAGCNPTIDASQQAEAQELLSSAYQRLEKVHPNYKRSHLNWDDFNLPFEFAEEDIQGVTATDMVEDFFVDSPRSPLDFCSEPWLPNVDDTEGQFFCPESQYMPNSDQDRSTGDGEPVLYSTGSPISGVLEFTQYSLDWNRLRKRSRIQ